MQSFEAEFDPCRVVSPKSTIVSPLSETDSSFRGRLRKYAELDFRTLIPVLLEGLKCATGTSLSIGLLVLDQILLGLLVTFSAYSSYVDWKTLTYSSSLALFLLLSGLASVIFRSILYFKSFDLIPAWPLDLVLALTCFFFLNKLEVLGEGDLTYFCSLCLCFPNYPYNLVHFLSRHIPVVPQVSYDTSLGMVILINTCLLTPQVLSLRRIVRSDLLLPLKAFLLLLLALGVTSRNLTLIVLLPLFLLHYLKSRGSRDAQLLPMIPCIFLSFVVSLTFGNLLLVLS